MEGDVYVCVSTGTCMGGEGHICHLCMEEIMIWMSRVTLILRNTEQTYSLFFLFFSLFQLLCMYVCILNITE